MPRWRLRASGPNSPETARVFSRQDEPCRGGSRGDSPIRSRVAICISSCARGARRSAGILSIAELLTCPRTPSRWRGAARTRQKQELQTTDDSSTNARLVCGTKPVQKLHTLKMNDMLYAYSENFIEIVEESKLKRFKVAANRQFLEFSYLMIFTLNNFE